MKDDFTLDNLDVYKFSCELSVIAWDVYKKLDLDQKIIIGQQFVKAVDSVGANIAEGYGRYHYLDKIKFYYNARASLMEAVHWANLLIQRELISDDKYENFTDKAGNLRVKLNGWIKFNLDKKHRESKPTNKQIN